MKMRPTHIVFAVMMAGLATTGEASAQASSDLSVDQAYAIVDFQTARSSRDLSTGLERYLNGRGAGVRTERPRASAIPRSPGRFTLVDPATPGGFGLEGLETQTPTARVRPLRIVRCDGASWRAEARQRGAGQVEQRYTLCLFPYRDGRRQGHHLDIYATTVLRSAPGGAQSGRGPSETPEAFMRGAVQAVERLTRSNAVWVEYRAGARSRSFPLDDDALRGETH